MIKSLLSVLACFCLVAAVGCESTQQANTEVAPGAVTECGDCTDKGDCDASACTKGEACCEAEAAMGAVGEAECTGKVCPVTGDANVTKTTEGDCAGKSDCSAEKVCPMTGEAATAPNMGAVSEKSDCSSKKSCCPSQG